MPDYLYLTPLGSHLCATAIEGKLRELLGGAALIRSLPDLALRCSQARASAEHDQRP